VGKSRLTLAGLFEELEFLAPVDLGMDFKPVNCAVAVSFLHNLITRRPFARESASRTSNVGKILVD